MAGLFVGLLCTLLAAGRNTGVSLLQAAGSRRLPGTGHAASQPLYLCGLGIDLLGFTLTVVALRYLDVFAVQAVLTSSIAMDVGICWTG